MKRLLISILSAIMILFMAAGAMAAGSSVTLSDALIKSAQGYATFYVVTATCVGDDGTGAIADTDIADGETGISLGGPLGWVLDEVRVTIGGTAPDAANVFIYTTGGSVPEDLLNGNGANLIHATDDQSTHPSCDGQPKQRPITGTIVLSVTEQTAVSAIYNVIMIFIKKN